MSDSTGQPNSGKPYIVEIVGTTNVNGMRMDTWEIVHVRANVVQCAVFYRSDHDKDGGGFETRAKVADRIAACLNACDGINPEAVPELVKACEAMLPYVEDQVSRGQVPGEDSSHFGDARAVAAARTALALAKGGVA